MRTDIKICGLKSLQALDCALDCGASHVGFIFFEKSPRHVLPSDAGMLRRQAHGRARAVAVTVNASDDNLDEIVRSMSPDMLQLHGNESPERVSAVRRKFGIPVIKAFAIRQASDFDRTTAYQNAADLFLFDAKPPDNAILPGGNGVVFDWSLLRGLDRNTRYMLSGGLNIHNVDQALTLLQPPGLDVSSGLERSPGEKDVGLIREFFNVVRLHQLRQPAISSQCGNPHP